MKGTGAQRTTQEAFQTSTGQVTEKGSASIYIHLFYLKTRLAQDQYRPKTGPSKRGGAVSPQD